MENCLFCQFAQGEGTFYKIHEDAPHMAATFEYDGESVIVVFPKKHYDANGNSIDGEELMPFLEFSNLIGRMIRRAYRDVDQIGSIMNELKINHFHEENFPIHDTRLIEECHRKLSKEALPKTAAGIAQRIANWAPRHVTIQGKGEYQLPEWIAEIITDASLLANNNSKILHELANRFFIRNDACTQAEVDEIIDTHR